MTKTKPERTKITTAKTDINTLITNSSLNITKVDTPTTTLTVDYLSSIRKAINDLETSFSNNCCQSNCNQTQCATANQTQCATANQTQCSTTNQSQCSCQTSTCQTTTCQKITYTNQTNQTDCTSDCNCNCTNCDYSCSCGF